MVDVTAIVVSLRLAAVCAAACLGAGVLACLALAGRRGRVARWLDAAIYLPLALPPVVLGLVLLAALHRGGPVGRLAGWVGLEPPAFTFVGIAIAATVAALPLAVRPMLTALRSIDPALVEAARSMGASRLQTAWHIQLPLAAPGLIAGSAIAFAHAVGQFGAILLVGGNLAGRTRTASIAIFDASQSLEPATAWATAGAAAAVTAPFLLLATALEHRQRGGLGGG